MNTIRFLAALAVSSALPSARAQSFTYTVENSKTTITGFSADPSGAVTVPSTLGGYTVTGIGRCAFKNRVNITSIGFASGASVTKLGVSAFQGCTGLQSISLPSGATTIPSGLLQGCSSLTSVTIPSTVTSIGAMAFADCTSLPALTLPTALTTLGASAISNCRSLGSLSIPSGTTMIPDQLCDECRSMTSIGFSGSVTSVGANAFHNCSALTSFVLPNTVTAVGDGAFSDCSSLSTFTIGTGLATLGNRAFQGCGMLATLTVATGNTHFSSIDGVLFDAAHTTLVLCPAGRGGAYTIPTGITTLADGAFSHCTALSGITLPATLTSIPADAFYYATALASPPLSSAVTSIGTWAYAGLKGVTGFTIPANVDSVSDDAFHAQSSLAWVIFDGDAPATVGAEIFDSAASGFTVYFHESASGFTTPTWLGYASAVIEVPAVIAGWLVENGFPPGTDLLSDPNQDGVNLLLAYALGLDPNLNLAGSMPAPVLSNGILSLTFHGNSSGVSYDAETSTDLQTWTSTGVSLTGPDGNGARTASIAAGSGSPAKFLRLKVATE